MNVSDRELKMAFNRGSDALWRNYPQMPMCPFSHLKLAEAFREGVRASLSWRIFHKEEGWHVVIDGEVIA